jgi:hypothetical protein
LDSDPIKTDTYDLSYLNKGYVRIESNVDKENTLEYEIRRVKMKDEELSAKGLLNWSPKYIKAGRIVH